MPDEPRGGQEPDDGLNHAQRRIYREKVTPDAVEIVELPPSMKPKPDEALNEAQKRIYRDEMGPNDVKLVDDDEP